MARTAGKDSQGAGDAVRRLPSQPTTSLLGTNSSQVSDASLDLSSEVTPLPSFRTWVDSGDGGSSSGRGLDERAGLRMRRGTLYDAAIPEDGGDARHVRPTWQDGAIRGACVALVVLSVTLGSACLQLRSIERVVRGKDRPPSFDVSPLRQEPAARAHPLARTAFEPVSPWVVHGACNSREQSMLRHFLRRIVLIVNANSPEAARRTSHFLRAVYGRFFGSVVIISPVEIPELQVEARGHKEWRKDWMFAYYHLPKVFARHPRAEGYLWINDDVAINYWRLLKANKSRLWMANNLGHEKSRWYPFRQGEKPLQDFKDDWAGTSKSRDSAWKCFDSLDEQYQATYKKSILPLRNAYPKRIVDAFYVPQRFVHAMAYDLLPVFREYKIWSEIAIPMMFYSLDDPQNFDHILDDMVVVSEKDTNGLTDHWSPDISAIHPWKLSRNASKISYLKTLGSVDNCLLRLLPYLET